VEGAASGLSDGTVPMSSTSSGQMSTTGTGFRSSPIVVLVIGMAGSGFYSPLLLHLLTSSLLERPL
jgi:uncharacterized spore protein YtfJ